MVPVDLQNAISRVEEIDLSPILWKLKNPVRGLPMSDDEIRSAETLYRQWLALNIIYPNKSIVPNDIVDTVWHTHILDTAKYAEDCQLLFGKFMHHYPYTDWLDAEMHQIKWEQTKELWLMHFNSEVAGVGLCDSRYCDKDVKNARPSYIPA
jgi:hypothetical protein